MAQRGSRKAEGPGESTTDLGWKTGSIYLLNHKMPASLRLSFLSSKMGMTLIYPFEGFVGITCSAMGVGWLLPSPCPYTGQALAVLGGKEGHGLEEQREEVVAAGV